MIDRYVGPLGDDLLWSDAWNTLVAASPLADDYDFEEIGSLNENVAWPGGNVDFNGHHVRWYCRWENSHQGNPAQGYVTELSNAAARLQIRTIGETFADTFTIENIHINQTVAGNVTLVSIGPNIVADTGFNINVKNMILKGAWAGGATIGLHVSSSWSKIDISNIKMYNLAYGLDARFVGSWVSGVSHEGWHVVENMVVYLTGEIGIQTPQGDEWGRYWNFKNCVACENSGGLLDGDWITKPLPIPSNIYVELISCADGDGTIETYYPNRTNCVGNIVPLNEFASLVYPDSDFLDLKEGTFAASFTRNPAGNLKIKKDCEFTPSVVFTPGSASLGINGAAPQIPGHDTDIGGRPIPGGDDLYSIGAFEQQYS
jgi:hypothetical protein